MGDSHRWPAKNQWEWTIYDLFVRRLRNPAVVEKEPGPQS